MIPWIQRQYKLLSSLIHYIVDWFISFNIETIQASVFTITLYCWVIDFLEYRENTSLCLNYCIIFWSDRVLENRDNTSLCLYYCIILWRDWLLIYRDNSSLCLHYCIMFWSKRFLEYKPMCSLLHYFVEWLILSK